MSQFSSASRPEWLGWRSQRLSWASLGFRCRRAVGRSQLQRCMGAPGLLEDMHEDFQGMEREGWRGGMTCCCSDESLFAEQIVYMQSICNQERASENVEVHFLFFFFFCQSVWLYWLEYVNFYLLKIWLMNKWTRHIWNVNLWCKYPELIGNLLSG